ncbi:hypothetical protein MNBD_GAMMA18-541 [hydrothermal vent metagenome]|uniref:Phosphatidylserine decarboxylase n=1 Tax=hydrothermal vent metagenome TaxID=652676 RepID=A0A3B0Z1X3_9ZZZZ
MALKTTPISEVAQWPVALLLLSALLCLLFWAVLPSIVLVLLALLVMFLYRDPLREIPSSPLGVISPVDGHVLEVEMATDTQLEREALVVTIAMPHFGPYIVRSPIEGKVLKQSYNVSARVYSQWIQTDERDDLVLSMEAGPFSGHLSYRVAAGERIGQGAQSTVLRFGRKAQLYLPSNSLIKVKKGDKVLAGEDILAMLVH